MLSSPEPIQSVLERQNGLLEGPTEMADGSIAFSDVLAGGIYRVEPGGELHQVLAKRRGIGGLAKERGGGLVATGRTLIHVDPESGKTRELASAPHAKGLNDLAVDPEGAVLVGVLHYKPLEGESERPGQLLRISPAGEDVLAEDVVWPNGIAVDAERKWIYVADYARRHVLVYPLGAAEGDGDVFCRSPQGSADGIALDAEGGLWVALGEGGGIARFTPDGELDGVVDVPARFVSNLCFAGPERRTVYITTADSLAKPENGGCIFVAESELAGMPLFECAV